MNSHEVAIYLINHPEFFEEHAEVLAKVKLTSPVIGRAISLQERQMEIVREKLKGMEMRLSDLMRVAHENDDITTKYQKWTRSLLLARNDVDLPFLLTKGLQDVFDLPYATLRLWDVESDFAHTWFAAETTEDVQLFAKGLTVPYCGKNQDFEAASWIETDVPIASVAMLPLRISVNEKAFGLVVLASPELDRFTKDMGIDYLEKIADTCSAALACLVAV